MAELSIEISRTNDLRLMRIFDTSHYNVHEDVDNYMVEVLPVNKTGWLTFNIQKDFSLILNSSNLRYKKANDSTNLIPLPDGVYEFKQSFKPNISTLAHYYHIRTVELRLKHIEMLCRHFSEECKKNTRQYHIEVEKLNKARDYIDAAEFIVDDKGDKKSGIKFYNKALEILKQLENDCGC